jgi:nucleotide-binding universal stress UspA family protein
MNTLLLATDGSDYARQAAREALELAEDRDATLHVLCVVDKRRFNHPALSAAELATIYAEETAAVCVREVTEMADERDVHVEGDIRHGIPEEVIRDYADDVDADLILMGEHGEHDVHFSGVGRQVLKRSDREVHVAGTGSR